MHSNDSDRCCMHIELDIKDSRIRYDAGDHVAIYPKNDDNLVHQIGSILNVDLDTVFTMRATDEDATRKNPFPCPTTYRTALSFYVDIMALPRTHVLKELSNYTIDEDEKAKLLLMSDTSQEGKDMYSDWIVYSCRSIVHILEDMPNCKPSIDHLLELLPRLQPRLYSISSSGRVHKESIHVTAVVVEYKTKTGRTNNGVCTKWLQKMIPSHKEYEFGWNRGNPKHYISRYEQNKDHRFRTRVRYNTAYNAFETNNKLSVKITFGQISFMIIFSGTMGRCS